MTYINTSAKWKLSGHNQPCSPVCLISKTKPPPTRDAYLKAANELKLATGPYKAARDAYVAATATYTKSLYE